MKIEDAIAGVTQDQRLKSISRWKSHYKSTRKYLVTPDVARALLATQANNRRVRERRVVEYARAMADGKWIAQTNQQIGVCADGRLIDGQHRLLAVILNGKPIEMEITVGMPIEVQKVIDGACPRNAEDHTGIPSKYCSVYKMAFLQAGMDVEYRCDWYLEAMHRSHFGELVRKTVDAATGNRRMFSCRSIKLGVAAALCVSESSVHRFCDTILENFVALNLQTYDAMSSSVQAFNRWCIEKGHVRGQIERELFIRSMMAFCWVRDKSKKNVALVSDKNSEFASTTIKEIVRESIAEVKQ